VNARITHDALRKLRNAETRHPRLNIRSVDVTRRGENCDAAAFKYGRNSRTQYGTYPVLRISARVAL
jgi:hypothetical protein